MEKLPVIHHYLKIYQFWKPKRDNSIDTVTAKFNKDHLIIIA